MQNAEASIVVGSDTLPQYYVNDASCDWILVRFTLLRTFSSLHASKITFPPCLSRTYARTHAPVVDTDAPYPEGYDRQSRLRFPEAVCGREAGLRTRRSRLRWVGICWCACVCMLGSGGGSCVYFFACIV
jgi:hypothetical protein